MAMISLLSQARQIRTSKNYNSEKFPEGVDRNAVATDGTAFLEDDLNVLRSLVKEVSGETNWYDKPQTNLKTLKDFGDLKFIQPVQVAPTVTAGEISVVTNKNVSVQVQGSNTIAENNKSVGFIYTDVTDAANVVEGTKAYVSVRNAQTNAPILDDQERKVFGIGSDDGNGKVKVNFYIDNNGTYEAISTSVFGSDTAVEMILPNRQSITNVDESFAMVNAGFADAVGSFEIGNMDYNAQAQTGTAAGFAGDLSSVSNFSTINDADITSAVKELFEKVGTNINDLRQVNGLSGIASDATAESLFTDDGTYFYIGNSTSLAGGIGKLDNELNRIENLATNASSDTVVTVLPVDFDNSVDNGLLTLPENKTYKESNINALNIYVNGMKLTASLTPGVAAGEGDFDLSSTDATDGKATKIQFNFELGGSDVISYQVFNSGN